AEHPVVTETDRDKYCVGRIIEFYRRHTVDLADYFFAAWRYHKAKHRVSGFAAKAGLSEKYLSMVWSILTGAEEEAGPIAVVRKVWRDRVAAKEAAAEARRACED